VKDWGLRELGFGEILDVSFQTVKDNFCRMLLISLIFWVPALVLYSGIIWAYLFIDFGFYFYGSFEMVLVSMIIIIAAANTLSMTAVMLIVDNVRQENDWNIRRILRQTKARLWPLLGSTFCFGLMLCVVILIFYVLFGVYGNAIDLSMLFDEGIFSNAGVLEIVLMLVYVCLLIPPFVRLYFYLPAVVFGKSAPALLRSWRLTRGNTWRLIGLLLVGIMLMLMIITLPSIAMDYIIESIYVYAAFTRLLAVVFCIFVATIIAVTYFDLLTRNEAEDLRVLAQQFGNIPTALPTESILVDSQAESNHNFYPAALETDEKKPIQ